MAVKTCRSLEAFNVENFTQFFKAEQLERCGKEVKNQTYLKLSLEKALEK